MQIPPQKTYEAVIRPWGYYRCLDEGKNYLTKLICVYPNQKLSLQSHNHRSEHWVILEGKAIVILNDDKFEMKSSDCIDIPVKAKHSLQNPYDEHLKILEVQKGYILSEEDIIRYADMYGRA